MINSIKLLSIGSLLAYIAMVGVNALANILPINDITTGEVSDSYPNLFAPAGITFSIWGLIYVLLAAYSVFQLWRIRSHGTGNSWLTEINKYFLISSLINSLWIFAWHYRLIGLSVVLMLGLQLSLIKIMDLIQSQQLPLKDRLFAKVPFGVYFGWITIAAIANIATFLVSLGWNGWGIDDSAWMIIVLLVGCAISLWRTIKDKNVAYGLVPIWAYAGIWVKHTSEHGFNGAHPDVIFITLFCIGAFILVNGGLLLARRAM